MTRTRTKREAGGPSARFLRDLRRRLTDLRRRNPPDRFAVRHRRIALAERLEDRTLLAAVAWDGGGGDFDWSNPANWDDDRLPGPADVVTIDVPEEITVSISAGDHSVRSIHSKESLTLAGGRLEVAETVQVDADFRLGEAVLAEATVLPGEGGVLEVRSGATLEAVTLETDLDLSNQRVTLRDGLTLHGTVNLLSNSRLDFAGTQALSGTGEIIIDEQGGQATLRPTEAGTTLTIGEGVTIRGGRGYVGGGSQYPAAENTIVINRGTIVKDQAECTACGSNQLTLGSEGQSFVNEGTLRATQGTLVLQGDWSNAGLFETLADESSTGTIWFNSDMNLAATALTLNGNGIFHITEALRGGTVEAPDGATVSVYGAVLDDVTFNSDFQVAGTTTVRNGLVINRTARADGRLEFAGTQTLAGTGLIELRGNLRLIEEGAALTVGHGITLHVQPNSHNAILGGSFSYPPAAGATLINRGVIEGDAGREKSAILHADMLLQNEGILRAASGTLRIDGAWTNSGSLETVSGGEIRIRGDLDNTGSTLPISGDGVVLSAVIRGGTIRGMEGAELQLTGGILDGVTADVDLQGNGTIRSGLVLNATANVRGTLAFAGSQTLSGGGNLVLRSPGSLNSHVRLNKENSSLTIGADITVQVGNGAFLGGTSGASGSAPGTVLINRGTIEADPGRRNYAHIGTDDLELRNEGVLLAASGTLAVRGPLSGSGRLEASGGRIDIQHHQDLSGQTLNIAGGGAVFVHDYPNQVEIRGGRLLASDDTSVHARTVVLDGVTLDADLHVGWQSWGSVLVRNGLTVNEELRLATADSRADFAGSQTLSGSGLITFCGCTSWGNNRAAMRVTEPGTTLTIGADVTVRSPHGYGSIGDGSAENTTIVNQGTIELGSGSRGFDFDIAADEVAFVNEGRVRSLRNGAPASNGPLVIAGDWTNRGRLEVGNNSTVTTEGTLVNAGRIEAFNGFISSENIHVNETGTLRGDFDRSIITVTHDLGGNTTNGGRDSFAPYVRARFAGEGTPTEPQRLEVMSRDIGPTPTGYMRNFGYGFLEIRDNTHVQLVDEHDNSPGTDPESLYVNNLSVATDSTLDLNGYRLYYRHGRGLDRIIGGSATQVADGGLLPFGRISVGEIAASGEVDEWNFFAQEGQDVTVLVRANSNVRSRLQNAHMTLFDPAGREVATVAAENALDWARADGLNLQSSGVYTVRVQAPAEFSGRTGAYMLRLEDTTSRILPLELNQPQRSRLDNAFQSDQWVFSGDAGQQLRLDLLASSFSDVRFSLAGPNDWVGFESVSGDSEPVTLPESGQYVLTVDSAGTGFGDYHFELNELSVTGLIMGEAFHGTIAATGEATLFRVDVPETMPLLFDLDDNNAGNQNEIYTRFGAPPSRSEYDFRSVSAQADQSLTVPLATAGAWYVLLYTREAAEPSEYALTARDVELAVQEVTPQRISDLGTNRLMISGGGLFDVASVELILPDRQSYNLDDFDTIPPGQIVATLDAATIPPATYALRVTKSNGAAAEHADAVTIVADGESRLETDLIVPNNITPVSPGTIRLEYANTGDAPMPAPLLVFSSSRPARLTVKQDAVVQSFWSAVDYGISDTVQILASGSTPGQLQPGERYTVPIEYLGQENPQDASTTFTVRALTADNAEPIDWEALPNELRPEDISNEAWAPIAANLRTQVGETWGDYLQAISENAAYLGRLGERVLDVEQLLAFEIRQANGFSILPILSSATDASLPAPGLSLAFGRTYRSEISSRYELGPLGRGWQHAWQISLDQPENGPVIIRYPGGQERRFLPDRRGGYLSLPGDEGELRESINGGFLLQEPEGTTIGFTTGGTLTFIEDRTGNRITAEYEASRLASLAHSAGLSLALEYNDEGRLRSVTDSDGRQTLYAYDASGQYLSSVNRFDGNTIRYEYASESSAAVRHALQKVDFPDGTVRQFEYDAFGRLAAVQVNEEGLSTEFDYDSAGTISVTDADGQTSRLFVDHQGRMRRVEDPFGNAATIAFDDQGRVTRITDAAGRSATVEYNRLGDPIQTVDPLGNATRFRWDRDFRGLASFTDARDNTTANRFDDNGNLIETTYPDGSTEQYVYDEQGNVTAYTNRRGQTMEYAYDSAGRLTEKIYPDDSRAEYVYDERGNLTSASDTNGTTGFEYDSNDRLVRIDYPGDRFLEFGYDAAGRRTSLVDQLGHENNYFYDSLGRLERLTDETGMDLVRHRFDGLGRLVRKELGNGVYSTYEHDAAGRLLELVNHGMDDSVLSRFAYTYDARDRRTSMTTLEGTWLYEYDDARQLTAWTAPDGRHVEYTYDALGNRITVSDNGEETVYTANALNQYVTVGDASYFYDADGNLTRRVDGDETTAYTYDIEGRLVGVQKGEDTWTYTYDALGQRVASTHNGDTTNYVIDPAGLGNVVGEYDGAGNLVAQYDHAAGLISRDGGDGTAGWYTFDAIGSTAEVTGAGGEIQNAYQYAPFGERLTRTETVQNPFEVVGEVGVMEETHGMEYMRARYYDRGVARFTSIDPIGLRGGDLNFYRYASNSPVTAVDPAGTSFFEFLVALSDHRRNLDSAYAHVASADSLQSAIDCNDSYTAISSSPASAQQRIRSNAGNAAREVFDATPSTAPRSPMAAAKGIWNLGGLFGDALRAKRYDEQNQNRGICGPINTTIRSASTIIPSDATHETASESIILRRARDPNEKTGPAGFGDASFIAPGTVMPYRVDFENDATATASAQHVRITDQLSTDFDWSTFSLTEFAFGDIRVPVPEASQSFQTSVPVVIDEEDFHVEIDARLNPASGLLTVDFWSIDPETGLPPQGIVGFLPPEDGTGRGQGHFDYTVQIKDSLPTGSEIRNIALITFDSLETIATNQVDPHDPSQGTDPAKEALVTIDAGAPASRVLPLPDKIAGESFLASWEGTDDAGGSGIASYDVYVSTDGGTYELWLDDTTETSQRYTGEVGSRYFFYSVATDNVGHPEPFPASPDAVTQLVAGPPGQNLSIAADVDNDGIVQPLDALHIIQHLNRGKPLDVETLVADGIITAEGPFYDVDGNGFVQPLDALHVINHLNRMNRPQDAEGELPPVEPSPESGGATLEMIGNEADKRTNKAPFEGSAAPYGVPMSGGLAPNERLAVSRDPSLSLQQKISPFHFAPSSRPHNAHALGSTTERDSRTTNLAWAQRTDDVLRSYDGAVTLRPSTNKEEDPTDRSLHAPFSLDTLHLDGWRCSETEAKDHVYRIASGFTARDE